MTVTCLRREEEEKKKKRSCVSVVFVDDVFLLFLCSEILFCVKCNKVTKARLWNQPSDCITSCFQSHVIGCG